MGVAVTSFLCVCWWERKATDSCKMILYLVTCWYCWFFLEDFWWNFYDLLYIVSCHMWIGVVDFFFSYFYSFFPSLAMLLQIPCLKPVEIVDSPVSFLISMDGFKFFSTEDNICCEFIIYVHVPATHFQSRVFIMKTCWILWKAFLHLLRSSYDFFKFIYIIYNVYWCVLS